MASIGARGHVTVGGRLEPDAKGFPASAMAKKNAGDWRDREQVHAWITSIIEDLSHSDGIA
jgi:menaquinone-dependent protoporphyrinogen oxidase